MDTLLRSSADASMLLQAVLDIVVDQALDVVEAFRSKLTGLEAKVLVSPDLDTVRHRLYLHPPPSAL
jgi:Mg2+ and Co2+ transporter CorA